MFSAQLNVSFMACIWYNEPPAADAVQLYSNVVFTAFYLLEMIVKVRREARAQPFKQLCSVEQEVSSINLAGNACFTLLWFCVHAVE